MLSKTIHRLGLSLLASTVAGLASAQQAGTYAGTSADGQNISFTVGTDTNTGALMITGFQFGLTANCNPGAFTFNTGWGLGADGTGADIVGKSVTYHNSYAYVDVIAPIHFGAAGAASGFITSYTPTFVPVSSGAPKKAAFCTSARQTFTATLGTSSSQAPAAVQGVTFGGQRYRKAAP